LASDGLIAAPRRGHGPVKRAAAAFAENETGKAQRQCDAYRSGLLRIDDIHRIIR